MKETPVHDIHVRAGARMVPFAGWDMPVQYEGILAEARAVRTRAGIFDVSHMGRFTVEGPDARALLDWVHTADIGEAMPVGRARYGLFCNERGGIIDDGIVYRLTEARFLVIANAANAQTVFAWLERWRDARGTDQGDGVTLTDVTGRVAMIALQGPRAIEIIAAVSDFDPAAVRPFRIAECLVGGRWAWVARTGYTGEDGVEIMPASGDASAIWDLLASAGAAPCGLGARDTLRLEAGLALHGNDIDETTNPIEAGLERFVAMEASDFCGANELRRIAGAGPERRLAGFRTLQRGAMPRQHAPILADGETVGEVTSGGFSPSLDTNIGLGYVPARFADLGRQLHVDVRGRRVEIETVAVPFYTRPRQG